MILRRLLLFSFVILITGCSCKQETRKIFLKRQCVYFDKNISIPKNLTFTFTTKNDKIIVNKNVFRKILHNYVYMRSELNKTKQDIILFNNMIKRINNGNK